MLLINKTYGQIFKLKDKGSMVFCEFRTIHKENSHVIVNRWRTFFVGDAVEKTKTLKNGDNITIVNGKISNICDNTNKSSCSLYINDFEIGNTIKETVIECPFI